MKNFEFDFGVSYYAPYSNFRVTPLFFQFMQNSINNLDVKKIPKELKTVSDGWIIDIIVIMSDTTEIKQLGPSRYKIDKIIEYGLHLPAKQIDESKHPFSHFVKLYFDNLSIFFSEKFGLDEDELTQIQKEVEEKFFNDTIGRRIE